MVTKFQSFLSEEAKYETFYHGSTHEIKEFNLDQVGNGHDQNGPGIYLTNSWDDARGYGKYVCTFKFKLPIINLMKETMWVDPKEIENLIKIAPQVEYNLSDWDENPAKGLVKATNAVLDHWGPKQYWEALKQVWYDHYRYDAKDFLQNINRRWVGIKIPREKSVIHFVVFRPDFLNKNRVHEN